MKCEGAGGWGGERLVGGGYTIGRNIWRPGRESIWGGRCVSVPEPTLSIKIPGQVVNCKLLCACGMCGAAGCSGELWGVGEAWVLAHLGTCVKAMEGEEVSFVVDLLCARQLTWERIPWAREEWGIWPAVARWRAACPVFILTAYIRSYSKFS